MGGVDYGRDYMKGISRNREQEELIKSLQQQATPHYLKDAREAWGAVGTGIGMVTGGYIPYKEIMMQAYDAAEAKVYNK
ncbi:MAG: hypothetical protein RLZZ86_96 [Cyanobacteriota bacterium]|jgi:hypothetical protein